METSTIRILVVDDYERYRNFIVSALSNQPKLQIIAEASDGLAAVQKAKELQPDLILLDIGLPKLNGIEAAEEIRELSPASKILFLSQESSADLVQAALSTGAFGYIAKSEAASDLLPAIEAVLNGKQFVSASLSAPARVETSDAGRQNGNSRSVSQSGTFASSPSRDQGHVVQFYADDSELLESLIPLFRDSLNAGDSGLAVLTEPHRIAFEKGLISEGIDVSEAITAGRFAIFDAHKQLSELMGAGAWNRESLILQFGTMIHPVQAAAFEKKRIIVFGEMVALLCEQQRYDDAMWFEELWSELALAHSLYLCCAYPESLFQGKSRDDEHYASICAQHSEVVSAF